MDKEKKQRIEKNKNLFLDDFYNNKSDKEKVSFLDSIINQSDLRFDTKEDI